MRSAKCSDRPIKAQNKWFGLCMSRARTLMKICSDQSRISKKRNTNSDFNGGCMKYVMCFCKRFSVLCRCNYAYVYFKNCLKLCLVLLWFFASINGMNCCTNISVVTIVVRCHGHGPNLEWCNGVIGLTY